MCFSLTEDEAYKRFLLAFTRLMQDLGTRLVEQGVRRGVRSLVSAPRISSQVLPAISRLLDLLP